MKKNLGQLIKSKREACGFSQAFLAHKVGISPSYLSRLEKGERNKPNGFIMIHLFVALDLFDEISSI